MLLIGRGLSATAFTNNVLFLETSLLKLFEVSVATAFHENSIFPEKFSNGETNTLSITSEEMI